MTSLISLPLKLFFTISVMFLYSCDDTTERRGGDGMHGYLHMEGEIAEVLIQNNQYHPREIAVNRGTNVRWMNEDEVDHTVTSEDGIFDSNEFSRGATFTYRFEEPGTYNYYCKIHPEMRGIVVVE